MDDLPNRTLPLTRLIVSMRELNALLSKTLTYSIPNKTERDAIIYRLLAHYLHVETTDYILNTVLNISCATQQKIFNAIKRLKQYEPIQYIIEQVEFLGNCFKVTPNVLIPRPETEEWTYFLKDFITPSPSNILDIGTGSGCIAITLKKFFPQATVDAIDISQEALKVAIYNAQKLKVAIHYMAIDILNEPIPQRKWALIVSNPPYVCQKEKAYMHPNVLHYEPHIALFVDDQDPLRFYRLIIKIASTHLHTQGRICVEINECFSKEIVSLLKNAPFTEILVHKDIHNKDRWITAKLLT